MSTETKTGSPSLGIRRSKVLIFAMFILFVKALIIGFILPIPLGPVGILIVRRTLSNGVKFGIICGIAVAIVDAFFAGISIYGSSFLYNFFIDHRLILEIIGSIFLVILGIATFFSHTREIKKPSNVDLAHGFLSSLVVTVSNPVNIISFVIVFTAFKVIVHHHPILSSILIVSGVFIGSTLWYVVLCSGIHMLRFRFTEKWLKIFHHACGVFILLSVVVLFLVNYLN